MSKAKEGCSEGIKFTLTGTTGRIAILQEKYCSSSDSKPTPRMSFNLAKLILF